MKENTDGIGSASERRLIGKVTPGERDEISALFERKNGLTELIKALAEDDDDLLKNSYFYEKIITDLGQTTTRHQEWWDRLAKHYAWESAPGCVWEIDFETCRIFLRNI